VSDERIIDEAPGVVASPARLEAWARTARAGDRFVYATRCSLPPGSAGAACARMLAARELVNLARYRVCPEEFGDTGVFSYFAERTSRPWSDAPAAVARPPRSVLSAPRLVGEVDEALEWTAVDRVLPILSRAAQFRRPCPTNHRLAELAELDVATVEASIGALKSLHIISIAHVSPPTYRLVTIVATAARTGLAA
jgi:hypothetical protein